VAKTETTGTPEPTEATEDFFAEAGTVTVYIDQPKNRYWVRVKRELDFGEQNELDNALVRGWQTNGQGDGASNADPAGMMAVVDLGKQRLMKLALYVDDWNLPGGDGKTVRWPARLPERMVLLKRMKPGAATMILAEIDRLIGETNETIQSEPDAEGNPTSGVVPAFGSAST